MLNLDAGLLATAERFLQDDVCPKAQEIDRDAEAMREALLGLCDLGFMALSRPLNYGGPGLPGAEIAQFHQMTARYSGALAFLQSRHQGAAGMVASSSNEALKREYLPEMANGKRLLGVAFSHFRRPGPPMMRAEIVEGGYNLFGCAPWVTGWSFFHEFLIGASLPSGDALFAPIPFKDQQRISVSPPMQLAAMTSAMTVSVKLDGYFVPEERIVLRLRPDWIDTNDEDNLVQHGVLAVGCAQAGLDILLSNAVRRNLSAAQTAHDHLSTELAQIEKDTRNPDSDRLELRARQIEMAVRCAHAAVASSSGGANSLSHPAQRVYREALVYTVISQTTLVMEATLNRLCRRQVGQ